MSVCLLIKDHRDAAQRLVPVSVQSVFDTSWVDGAKQLGLPWVEQLARGHGRAGAAEDVDAGARPVG